MNLLSPAMIILRDTSPLCGVSFEKQSSVSKRALFILLYLQHPATELLSLKNGSIFIIRFLVVVVAAACLRASILK